MGDADIAMEPMDWRKAHPAFIVIQFLRNVRGLAVPFVVVLFSRGMSGSMDPDSLFIWISLAIAFVVAAASYFSWHFFRFRLSERQLLVRSGFINKQERTVSFERIQAVNIEEAPLDRIFGVVRVRVETAAGGEGGKADITIEALTRAGAEDVRLALVHARQVARGDVSPTPVAEPGAEAPELVAPMAEGRVVRTITTRELLIAGATSGRIGPAAAIVGFAAQFADELVPQSWWGRLPWNDVAEVVTSIQAIFVVVLVLGLFAWVLSVASTVLSVGGFEIRIHGDQLFVQAGLLDRRRLTIPLQRIQAVRVAEGMLRQPFGLAEVRFESAGYNTESGANGVLFPLLHRSEIVPFLREVAPDFAVDSLDANIRPVPKRALSRYLVPGTVTMLVLVGVVIGIAWWATDEVQVWSLFGLVLVPLVAMYSWLEFHDAGWRAEGEHLLIRRRNGARETVITRTRRLQTRRIAANVFQRRARLVTFGASVASGGGGGSFSVAHIDRADGEYLLAALAPLPRRRV